MAGPVSRLRLGPRGLVHRHIEIDKTCNNKGGHQLDQAGHGEAADCLYAATNGPRPFLQRRCRRCTCTEEREVCY